MDYKGLHTQVHGGAWMGYRSFMVRFPEQKFSVAVLANVDSVNTFGLVYQVADIFLADQFKEEPRKPASKVKPVKISQKLLQEKTGTYRNTTTGNFWQLAAKKGKLLVTTTT